MIKPHIYERSNMRGTRIHPPARNQYYEISTNVGDVIGMWEKIGSLGFQVTGNRANMFYGYVRVEGHWNEDNELVWDEGVPPGKVDPEVCTSKVEHLDGVLKVKTISHEDYIKVLKFSENLRCRIS